MDTIDNINKMSNIKTVRQLIKELQKFDSNMPVLVGAEGVYQYITDVHTEEDGLVVCIDCD